MGQDISTLSVKEFCAAEVVASRACLDATAYDREKCQVQFDDYRDCKRRWREYRRAVAAALREGAEPPPVPPHIVDHLAQNPPKDARAASAERRGL